MDLRDALFEVHALKELWQEERFDDYFLLARAFLEKWREPIKDAARHPEPFLRTIRCLEALLVIHNNIATADEDAREEDEDLFLDTAPRFRPWTPEQQLKHDFELPNLTSNIAKRRAFAALRRGQIDEASVLFEQAVSSAELAASLAGPEEGVQGATKHLQYLRFHRAIAAMLLAEAEGLTDDAEAWWRHAKNAADHAEAASELFMGRGYILGRKDLDAYIHLIEALRAFLLSRFEAASEGYDAWLSAVPEYRGHWRFQNVVARKRLAELLACVEKGCPRCTSCLAAAKELESLLNRWGVGRVARELARIGLAIFHLERTFEANRLHMILDSGVFPLLPLGASAPESTSPTSGNYVGQLPHYFVGLSTELKGLRRFGCSEIVLKDFILRRLRDFVEICGEYEQGRTAILFGHNRVDCSSFASLDSVVACVIEARTSRKGPNNFGTVSWQNIKDQISSAEKEQQSRTALDTYEVTVKLMAAYFPAIVRVVARESRKETGSAQTEYITSVEQLGSDEFDIKSQFPLEGEVGYLPPRYVRQSLTEKLLTNDRSKWIPASKAAALFVFQTIPVWEGDWRHFENEFESQFLDFKQEQPKSLAKHLAAFANTQGGWLVFGIYDPDGRVPASIVRGLDLTECTAIVDAVSQAGMNEVNPLIVPTTFFRAYPEGKLVILYRIDPSLIRPHRVVGRIYVRIGSASKPITDEAWRRLNSTVSLPVR